MNEWMNGIKIIIILMKENSRGKLNLMVDVIFSAFVTRLSSHFKNK
jgi:hypothetical protein